MSWFILFKKRVCRQQENLRSCGVGIHGFNIWLYTNLTTAAA
jgi:hypothetical protein